MQAWPLLLGCYAPNETVAGKQAVKYVQLHIKAPCLEILSVQAMNAVPNGSECGIHGIAAMQPSKS